MKTIMRKLHRKLRGNDGFTLVELIVVLVIMGILTAALIPTVTGYIGDAQSKVDASNLRMAEQAALLYLTDYEISGNADVPDDLTVQDLIDAGYLSGTSDELAEEPIRYTDEGNGKYSVTIGTPESDE